jgi:hypothetical protein
VTTPRRTWKGRCMQYAACRYRIAVETIRALLGCVMSRPGGCLSMPHWGGLSCAHPQHPSATQLPQVPRRRIFVGRIRARRVWGKLPSPPESTTHPQPYSDWGPCVSHSLAVASGAFTTDLAPCSRELSIIARVVSTVCLASPRRPPYLAAVAVPSSPALLSSPPSSSSSAFLFHLPSSTHFPPIISSALCHQL